MADKRKILNNTLWIVYGHIIKMVVSLLIGILTARYLGPSNYGLISYVNSYILFFTAIINMGLNGVIVNDLVNQKEKSGQILGTSIVLRFIVGILSIVAFILFMILSEKDSSTIIIIAILQSIQLMFLCLDTIQYWFQSRLESKRSVVAQLIAYVLTSLYKVVLLIMHKTVEWFAFSATLDVIILGGMYLFFFYNKEHPKLRFTRRYAKEILSKCWPFIFASILVVIYGHTDKIMIKYLLNDEVQVGLYSTAIVICTMIGFVPNAILESGRPIVLESQQIKVFERNFKYMTAAVLWVCLLYSCMVSVLGYYIVRILYGLEFIGAVNSLKIAVWYTAFSYVGSAKSVWLIYEKKNKYVMKFSLIGVIINVALNFLMIPRLGIEGAAAATLITEVMVNFIVPYFVPATKRYSELVFESFVFKGINLRDFFVPYMQRIKKIIKH